MYKSVLNILESWEIDIKQLLAKLILGLIVLALFYILGKVTKRLAYKINAKIFAKHADWQKMLSTFIYYFFVVIGYYLFLEILGLEQYLIKLLAGAGIVGIIAGFALRDIASNAFSGLLLIIEKPYKKGDWIQVDGQYGQVNNVGILTTALINRTGQQVYVSNQLIYSGAFLNYSVFQKRGIRIQTDIIQYFDLEQLRALLGEQLKKVSSFVPNQNIHFFVNSISKEGNYAIEISFWVLFDNEPNFLKALNDTFVCIKQVAIDNKIDIVNTVWVSGEENSTAAGDFGYGG